MPLNAEFLALFAITSSKSPKSSISSLHEILLIFLIKFTFSSYVITSIPTRSNAYSNHYSLLSLIEKNSTMVNKMSLYFSTKLLGGAFIIKLKYWPTIFPPY